MDEEPTNNSNGIVDPVEPETEASIPIPEDAAPAAGEASPATAAKASSSLTGEKVLDIALGVAVIAGEVLDKAAQRLSERAKELQEQSPTFWDTAEERGRPIREKLVSTLKGTSTSVTTADGAESTEANGSGLADSLRHLGRDIGLSVGGVNTRPSAEDEIRSLEDRVRELEQVVVSGKTGVEPELPETPAPRETAKTEAPLSENEPEPVASADEVRAPSETSPAPTTAESFSYAFGEDKYEDFLAASPYAVSETDDERTAEASASVGDVESAAPEETAPPAPEALPTEPAPPSSGRSSRKKQRDFDPEATDENAPTPSPEA